MLSIIRQVLQFCHKLSATGILLERKVFQATLIVSGRRTKARNNKQLRKWVAVTFFCYVSCSDLLYPQALPGRVCGSEKKMRKRSDTRVRKLQAIAYRAVSGPKHTSE